MMYLMTNTANKTRKTVTIDCGKCGGNGRYYFHGGHGVCFSCEGTGKQTMSAVKYAKLVEGAKRYEAVRADYDAVERHEDESFNAATGMIDSQGIQGARNFFAANRTDHTALCGLVNAMRNAGLMDASNAVVRHMAERSRAGMSDGVLEFLASRK
jgi:hypothetical protein